MNVKETILALAVTFAMPALAHAGGPVIVEEDFVAEARPSSEGRWIIPVIVGLVVICAIACGSDDEPAPVKPVDPCRGCE